MTDKIIINAVGDIIAGDHPLYLGIGVRTLAEKGVCFFEHVEGLLKDSNITFGNLESVLFDDFKKKRYANRILRGDVGFVKQLDQAGFGLLNIANNHIQQHGNRAFHSTIEILKQNDIDIIGNESFHPYIATSGDRKVAFYGYSMRPEQHADEIIYSMPDQDKMVSDIIKVRDDVDYLVISLHWGDEYVSCPSNAQKELAHKLIDNGANVIIGHHPHVLQGIEKYGDGIIAYSLGNFVSDMCQDNSKRTIVLRLILGLNSIDYEVVPCVINDTYQPVPLKGEEKNKALRMFDELSDFPNLSDSEYQRDVDRTVGEFRSEYKKFLRNNWHKYPMESLVMILSKFVLRRLGIRD
ncbi:MAG: CapA family protein [Phycisphaerae bacterium]|nr:CapA family protein [Phycisphaerae bacterium]